MNFLSKRPCTIVWITFKSPWTFVAGRHGGESSHVVDRVLVMNGACDVQAIVVYGILACESTTLRERQSVFM